METDDINKIHKLLNNVRNEIINDEYLCDIPSIKKSIKHFHAKDDCPEVREKIFKVIHKMDIKVHVIIARKNSDQFRSKFNAKSKKLYEYLVTKLFENRLHLYSEIDIYFSKMGNIVREHNMNDAINAAMSNFEKKWGKDNKNDIRIFIQEPSQISGLQVIDYLLWVVFRAYTKGEMRYFNFMKDKYSTIIDIFDNKNYPNIYYTKKNLFDIKKISPLEAR